MGYFDFTPAPYPKTAPMHTAKKLFFYNERDRPQP